MPPDQVATDNTQAQPVSPAPQPKSRSQIAREVFGNDFKGEVVEAAPTEPKTEEPKPDDAQKGEVPIEEPTEGEQEIAEPKVGEETAPAEGTGEMPIVTVSELVEHLEAPPEWFDNLKMSFNVDGMPTEATIKELVDSYQLEGAARHRLETAKEIAQKESEAWAAKQQALEGQFRVAAELIKGVEAALDRDVKAIDPQLRDNDPAEWAARIQEFGQRRADIQAMKNAAVQQYTAHTQAQAQEADARRQQFAMQQQQMLLEKLPEYRNEEHANLEKIELQDYLSNAGFTAAEMADLIDHRQFLLVRKAMLYDKSRGAVDAAKKRVATVPKMMKSGAPKPREQLAHERLQQLLLKSKQSGTDADALAYRLAKRGVSR